MNQNVLLIGFGTAAIGRPQYINIREQAANFESLSAFKAVGMRMLDAAYELGIRYFDTAPGYGMAEHLLIEWLSEKRNGSIEIATKWGYTYTANFDPKASVHEVKEHTLDKLNEQWEQSKRLLPNLSTYQIHSATFETGVLENEAVLNRLAQLKGEHGLRIGLSTSGASQVDVLKKAIEIERDGMRLFEVFQVTYNIFDQSLAEIAGSLVNSGSRLVIKEALANGRIFPNEDYPEYKGAYLLMSSLAAKYGVGIDAIALRFCMDSIPVYSVLSGAAEILHLEANLRTREFQLEKKELEQLQQLAVNPAYYWAERKQLAWN